MQIATIKKLDIGMSNITCTGIVDYCKEAENKKGVHNGKDYSFWTQFVVLKDNSGDIGVNLSLGDNKVHVAKGQEITVEKATLGSYSKDGKTYLTLKGKLYAVQNVPQNAPQPLQAPKAPQGVQTTPQNRDGSICRQTAGKCAVELLKGTGASMFDILSIAEPLAKWFETGIVPSGKVDEPQTHSITEEPDDLPEGFGEEPQAGDSNIPF